MAETDLVDTLNSLWTTKRALIDQYVARSKVRAARGDERLAEQFSTFAFAQMREVSALLDRIVELGGIPQLQAVEPVSVGDLAEEQLQHSLVSERSTIATLEKALRVCEEAGHKEVIALVGDILGNERARLEWLQSELRAT